MGLGEVDELRARCEELERLYSEAVAERDEAIEERNKTTVLIALQLERETSELTTQIEKLTREKKITQEKNEDLSIRFEYAREDLNKIKQSLIRQQLEHEKYIRSTEKASEKAKKEIEDLRTQNCQLVTEAEELKQKQDESTVKEIEQLTKERDQLFCEIQQLKQKTNAVTQTKFEEIHKESNNLLSNTHQLRHILSSDEEKGAVKTSEDKQDPLVEREVMQTNQEQYHGNSYEQENNMLHNTQNGIEPNVDENENEGDASEKLEYEPRDPVAVKASNLEDVYEIQEELGKGRFGVVKKAVEKASGQVYAAKYIKLSTAGSKKEDVMREIDIMNKLNSHKRLVMLVDAYHVARSMVMILEFVSGGELFDRVVECDYLTEKEASCYMNQLLQGLQYMHGRSIVHLDLKPENIVCVSKDSLDIKLIDFGLAQVLQEGVKLKALRGTPEFMSPEAVNFDTITFATDMWSVGVIAYILLSGLSPLMGDDDNETLSNVTSAQWDFEDEAFDEISEQAKDFMSKLIVKKPSERLTVSQCLEHEWITTRVISSSVKLNTKKLRQFLAKRRWQKSVNALVAVRRLSSVTSLLGMRSNSRPSMIPSLKTLKAAESEGDDTQSGEESHIEKTENKENPNTSADFTKPVAPTFNKELTDITVKKTETVNCEVVVSGDLNCNIEWYKNGGDVVEGERHSLVNRGNGRFSLVISDSTDDDTGEYCCVASNTSGRVTTACQLTVEMSAPELHPPVFEEELTDVTVNEDDTVTFEVLVSGDPNCVIEWYKNGVDVEVGPRHAFINGGDGHYKLVITQCEDDDTGEYCCVASNEAGRATAACDLTVELPAPSVDPPVFENEFGDVSVYEGETVSFEVLVSGDINCDIDWYKNGGDVEEGPRYKFTDNFNGLFSLVISECEDDDTGEYCCVASNVAGRVTAAGNLLVKVEDEEEEESEEEEDWPEFQYRTVKIRDGCVDNTYVVEAIQLGRGRFGIARKCIELDSGDRYVAKYIKARPSQKAEVKREVFVMNALQHPRLVGLYDAIEEPRYIILILEFMRGGSLASRTGGSPLPEMEAAQIMTQVLEGVKAIHDKGYMHLDLKPENIMFRLEGGSQVKIIDFSLSRKYNPGDEIKVNFGTAEYVAPEIVNYESISLSTDMWAVGIICYMMLGGQSPFLGKSESETFANITSAKWSFTEEFDDISDEAKDFVSKLLVKNPKGRMTVEQCLEHPWIKSGGVGSIADLPKISVTLPNGDVCDEIVGTIDQTGAVMQLPSSGENQAQDFNNNELLEIAMRKLEIKVSQLELEKSELTDDLNDEKEKVESLEDDMKEGRDLLKELHQKIAKLEKENKKLSTEFRSKNDLLVKVGRLENQRRTLEENLEEQSKVRDTLEEKYKELRDKMETFDSLEEKMYRFEREKKELQYEKEKLEEKILDYESEKLEISERSESLRKAKDSEILQLKQERDEIENKYDTLRRDKETLVAELTCKFTTLEEQRRSLGEQKKNLESNVSDLSKERENTNTNCKELSIKLKAAEERIAKLKQRTSSGLERKLSGVEKEKEATEKENSRLKKHNENIQKTCEDLASKLSKVYAEMEKYKAGSANDDTEELMTLKEEVSSLKERVVSVEEEREHLRVELDECDAEIEDLQKKVADQTEENKRLLEENQQHYKEYIDSMPIANDEGRTVQSNPPGSSKRLANIAASGFKTKLIALESSISVLKSEKALLREKLSMKEQEVSQLKYTVKSQEKEIQRAKEQKATLINRYEKELEEAEDLFESRETEIRAGYEKRIEALESLGENEKSRDTKTNQSSSNPTTLSSMIEETQRLDNSQLGETSKRVAQILSKQIDMLDQMANEDVVMLISKKDAIVHELQSKCELLESQLKKVESKSLDYTKLQDNHEQLQENYDELESQLKDCASVALRAEKERDSLKKDLHELEVQLNMYTTAESKPQEPEKSKNGIEHDLQLFETLQEERTWLKEKVTELEQVKKEIEISLDAVKKEAARLNKHNIALELCLTQSNQETEKVREEVKTMKTENEKIAEQLFSYQDKYEQLQNKARYLEEYKLDNEDKTVVADRKLTELEREKREGIELYYQLQEESSCLKVRLAELESENESIITESDSLVERLKNEQRLNSELMKEIEMLKNSTQKAKKDIATETNDTSVTESVNKDQSEHEANLQTTNIVRDNSSKIVSENIMYSESIKVQMTPQIESVDEVANVSKDESPPPFNVFQSQTVSSSDDRNTGWQSLSNAELKWLENGPKNVAEDMSILQIELQHLKEQLQGLEAEKEEGLRILDDLQNKNKNFEKQKEQFQLCLEKQMAEKDKSIMELNSIRRERGVFQTEKEEEIQAVIEIRNALEQKCNRYETELQTAREDISRLKSEMNLAVEINSTENVHTMADNKRLVQEIASLKQQYEAMEHNYYILGKENESLKRQFDAFSDELKANDKEKEQLQNRYFRLQEKYQTLKSSFREMEEELSSEMGKLQDIQQIVQTLTRERDRLRRQNSSLCNEKEKCREELSSLRENIADKANIEMFEKQIAFLEASNTSLENKLSDAKQRFGELQKGKNAMEKDHEEMKEEAQLKIHQLESQKAELMEEKEENNCYKAQTSALQQEIRALEEKLQNATEVKGIEQKKSERQSKEGNWYIFEVERMRQRLISNILKPLEEINLPMNLREVSRTDTDVGSNDSSSADVDASRNEVWYSIRENIVMLIRERERFMAENKRLKESWARLKKEYQIKRDECNALRIKIEDVSKELDESKEDAALSINNAGNTNATANLVRKLKLEKSEKEKLKIQTQKASTELDTAKRELNQVREEKENLVRMINLFEEKRTQLETLTKANAQVEEKLRAFEAKWEEMENFAVCRHGETDVDSEETEDVLGSEISPQEVNHIEEYEAVDWEIGENTCTEDKFQVELMRELVRKNRRIFELVQENSSLSKKLQEAPNDAVARLESVSKELESVKLELETVRQEKVTFEKENTELNKYIKTNELAALLKEIEELKAVEATLRREKDGLTSDLSARDRRIVLFEKEIKDLTSSRAINGDATKGHVTLDKDGQEQLDMLRNELREVRHGEALLQAELQKLRGSHECVLREAQEEMERKWSRRLRKECMELQNELTDKHAAEKRILLKKEADLQNIVRQMKLVMDKRAQEFDRKEKRLKRELISAKNPLNNSTVSLNSSSDESGEVVNNSSLSIEKTNPKDTLSDRELRRVAYKLNSEEWSQLGTFLGLVDSELFAIGSLNMGPQEKAFRVACAWRTRCKLGRSQMVSQLAIALEEIRRKDAAQFVIEQFLEGKGRKKFFGW